MEILKLIVQVLLVLFLVPVLGTIFDINIKGRG